MNKQKDLKILWLYLAKRDKKGVQILAKLLCREINPIALSSIKILGLPPSWEGKIADTIEQNKIYWEPWVQTAETFDEIKLNLKARGYSNIPVNGNPMILITPQVVVNINNFPKQKNMVQKGTIQ
jgi:hypothetical protein